MRRFANCLFGLTIVFGLIGCDSGGPPVGPASDVSGAVNPPGFEDMMKKTGGAMGNPAKSTVVKKEAAKETPKEETKEAPKDAPK